MVDFSSLANATLSTPKTLGGTMPQVPTTSPFNGISLTPTTVPNYAQGQLTGSQSAGATSIYSTPISVSSLQTPQTPVYVPPAPVVSNPLPSAMSQSQALINQMATQAQTDFQTTQGNVNTSLASLQGLYDKLGTKPQAQSDLEAAQGLPQKNLALQQLNNDLMQTNAQALQANVTAEGRQEPTFAIQGEQAQIERQRAVQVYAKSAAISALNGEISNAQDYVTKSIAAQFDPIQQQIAYQQQLLNVNRDNFTAAQKERADAVNSQLDLYKTQVAEQRQDFATGQTLAISAMTNNPNDPQVLYNAQQAMKLDPSDPQYLQKVGQLVGQYQSNPLKTAQDIADLQLTRAQTLKAQKDAQAASNSGFDPGEILAYAQQYSSTGTIPTGMPKGSFGLVSQIAKETPKADGTIISNSTGVVPSNVSSAQADGMAAMYDLSKKLTDLGTLYSQIGQSLTPQSRQQYDNLKNEIVDLLSRARSGAALTESEVATYSAKLPKLGLFPVTSTQLGLPQIQNLQTSISGKLNTSLTAHNSSIVGFSKVNIGGQQYTVGQQVTNSKGQTGVVNSDGTITIL